MVRRFSKYRHHSGGHAAFTLIETSLAMAIVGLGVVAAMSLFAACTSGNRSSALMSTAMMLCTNIQEAMGGLSFADPGSGYRNFGAEANETDVAVYDDVDDFDRRSFNPPIDSLRQPIPELGQYTQLVSVWPIYPNKLSVNSNESSPDLPKTGFAPNCTAPYTGAVRVRVRILYAARAGDVPTEVFQHSWVRLDN
ncbi:type IV pilus modification PilV family protein [Fontivita pretiosa]|uniref:type IV pilus modification PilV family protein n=1 Tax=Fontivita pretiosa TaxID=2989684 RepID=UPI003D180774